MQFCNQKVSSDLRHPPAKITQKKKKKRNLKLSLILVSLSTILSVYIYINAISL